MSLQILVVDDERLVEEMIKSRFRKEIRAGEISFHFALNGQLALDILDAHPDIGILLCDIEMPVMDGLTLLAELRNRPRLMRIIMVTAYGNMDNIRAAMNQGAFDFITKPIDFKDLKATIVKAREELEQFQAGEEARRQLPITQQQLEETDEKARYLEELDQFKTTFFTNISHEFRTPLTVMKGMIGQVREKPEEWLDKGSELILGNIHQLLNLVNQILDLQKLEAGKLELNLIQGKFGTFFSSIADSFEPLAGLKQIEFIREMPQEEMWMDYDPEKMLRIFSNLFSNAIKFTPEGGTITCKLVVVPAIEEEKSFPHLQLIVTDTGIGISEEKIPYIFDRFYQADHQSTRQGEGTGIGLSLVKELVELMDGAISVASSVGEGTSFELRIPITQQAPRSTQGLSASKMTDLLKAVTSVAHAERPEDLLQEALPRLLIIEDNPSVATYLVSVLKDRYSLLLAKDGEEGIDRALAEIPDLILSDVMMPQKDGFEVCDALKQHTLTSHIPIILLTAKADHASRIAGLKRGADAYLPKPFDVEELDLTLHNLLEARKLLQARYQHGLPQDASADADLEPEDRFMTQLYETLNLYYADPDFNVPMLCRHMGVSRSSLHRKVTALTSKSITNLIKEYRLAKATDLLKGSQIPIADIAYEVGFSAPSYFNRVFSLSYGVTPGSYRRMNV
ncbi:MAG: response regulator [Bacteroidota bacterium]